MRGIGRYPLSDDLFRKVMENDKKYKGAGNPLQSIEDKIAHFFSLAGAVFIDELTES